MSESSAQEQSQELVFLLEDLRHLGGPPDKHKTWASAIDRATFLAAHCDTTFMADSHHGIEPMNALMACCKIGFSDELFDVLLERSDTLQQNWHGTTALMLAAGADPDIRLSVEKLGKLIAKSDMNAKNRDGLRAIQFAAHQPDDLFLREFVRLGWTNLYCQDDNWATLLIHAAKAALKHESTECLDFLIERVDPRRCDRSFRDPASYCRESSNPAVAAYADRLDEMGCIMSEREALSDGCQKKASDGGSDVKTGRDGWL